MMNFKGGKDSINELFEVQQDNVDFFKSFNSPPHLILSACTPLQQNLEFKETRKSGHVRNGAECNQYVQPVERSTASNMTTMSADFYVH